MFRRWILENRGMEHDRSHLAIDKWIVLGKEIVSQRDVLRLSTRTYTHREMWHRWKRGMQPRRTGIIERRATRNRDGQAERKEDPTTAWKDLWDPRDRRHIPRVYTATFYIHNSVYRGQRCEGSETSRSTAPRDPPGLYTCTDRTDRSCMCTHEADAADFPVPVGTDGADVWRRGQRSRPVPETRHDTNLELPKHPPRLAELCTGVM